MVEIINNFLTDFTGLVQIGISLLALVFVATTWVRTKSLAPTLGALILGAVVIWGVNSMPGPAAQHQRGRRGERRLSRARPVTRPASS